MMFLFGSIILLMLIILLAALWVINYIFVKKPEQQLMMLEKFVNMAVKRTEQLYPIFEEDQKYHDIKETVKDMFDEASILMPGALLVDAAIRSSIYALWKEQELLGLERLKAELEQKNSVAKEDTHEINAITRITDTDRLDNIFGIL